MATLLIPGVGLVEAETTLLIPGAGLVEQAAAASSFNPAWARNSNQIVQADNQDTAQ